MKTLKAVIVAALVLVATPAGGQTKGYSSIPSPALSKTTIIVVTPPVYYPLAPPMTGPFIFSGPGKKTVVCSWIVGVGWLCSK